MLDWFEYGENELGDVKNKLSDVKNKIKIILILQNIPPIHLIKFVKLNGLKYVEIKIKNNLIVFKI